MALTGADIPTQKATASGKSWSKQTDGRRIRGGHQDHRMRRKGIEMPDAIQIRPSKPEDAAHPLVTGVSSPSGGGKPL